MWLLWLFVVACLFVSHVRMSGLSEVKFGKTGKVPGAGFVLPQRTCVPFFLFFFVTTIWRVCLVKEIFGKSF